MSATRSLVLAAGPLPTFLNRLCFLPPGADNEVTAETVEAAGRNKGVASAVNGEVDLAFAPLLAPELTLTLGLSTKV